MKVNDPRLNGSKIWEWIGKNLTFEAEFDGIVLKGKYIDGYWNTLREFGYKNTQDVVGFLNNLNGSQQHKLFNKLRQMVNENK